jgi:hypothetical protein
VKPFRRWRLVSPERTIAEKQRDPGASDTFRIGSIDIDIDFDPKVPPFSESPIGQSPAGDEA